MNTWELLASSVVGGLVGGTLGAYLSARYRAHAVETILARMDDWGAQLRAGTQQVQHRLDDGLEPGSAVDPQVLEDLRQLDRRDHPREH